MPPAAPLTLSVMTNVGPDHRVTIELPSAIPEGEVELFVVAVPKPARKRSTLGDLLDSDIVGMWAGRTDLPETDEGFAEYRRSLWERPRGSTSWTPT